MTVCSKCHDVCSPEGSAGIIRHMDNAGRLCLPKAMRDLMSINTNDPIIMTNYENGLFIRKYVEPRKKCVHWNERKRKTIMS